MLSIITSPIEVCSAIVFTPFILFSTIGLEPRVCTRWDMHKFARDAYELGIRYIGGCCGFEPYHIRAIAEEVRFLVACLVLLMFYHSSSFQPV